MLTFIKELSESYHQTKLQEYGVQTIHTSNKGKNYADLKITTDLLENMYNNNNVDGFILVSNDKDMTPLISQVKKYKDFIYLITAGSNYDNSVLSFPDKHITIDEIKSVQVEEKQLLINKMNEEVLTNLKDYLRKKLDDASITQKHIELNYYIENSFSHFRIMKYEFANILKNLYDNKKLILYKYEYSNKQYTGLMEASLKDECISKSLFKENDITKNYDFESLINKIYNSYKK